jgi:hypothetical protein
MADEEKNTEDEMMPEDTSSGDVADMGGTDMGDAELDMPEEQPQRPSRVSKIFASIPPIPEYPIAKPVETEQDEDDSMEPGFGSDEDGEDSIDDLVDISEEDMDDMVGMDDVVGDLSKDVGLTPQDEDFLYGTGPELPRPKKKVKYGASGKKRVAPRDTDTYMSGLL